MLLAACLGIFLFAVAFATSERVRVDTMNVLIRASETNTVFQFLDVQEKEWTPSLGVGWAPEGYTLVDKDSNTNSIWFTYYDQEGHFLDVDCIATQGTTVSIDTENARMEKVSVQGNDAMLIVKDYTQLVWLAKGNTVFLTVMSDGLSREELLKVAESLAY